MNYVEKRENMAYIRSSLAMESRLDWFAVALVMEEGFPGLFSLCLLNTCGYYLLTSQKFSPQAGDYNVAMTSTPGNAIQIYSFG